MDNHPINNLQQGIDTAHSIEQLRGVSALIPDMVRLAVNSGEETTKVVQLISRLNDAVTLRLIALLQSRESIRLPEGATFLVLGSEGRGEQTLHTDQDNAIVYSNDLSSEQILEVERFANRLVTALEEIGVQRCPGKIMACNPQWCHCVSEWQELLALWIENPTPEHVLNFGKFQDLRALHGNEALAIQLRDHICTSVQCHNWFFPNMANHVVHFPSPFTCFGQIRTEESDNHKGMVDLKKAGIFAITTGASLLALEYGIIGGCTWKKLETLFKAGFFSSRDYETITKAFTFLVQLRLQQQLLGLSSGNPVTDSVDLRLMTENEHEQFRRALNGVDIFLWIFRDHYQLDFIA